MITNDNGLIKKLNLLAMSDLFLNLYFVKYRFAVLDIEISINFLIRDANVCQVFLYPATPAFIESLKGCALII